MAQPRQAQRASTRRWAARQWTLGSTAPGWFRRIWTERSREVPKLSEGDLKRIRRITYL